MLGGASCSRFSSVGSPSLSTTRRIPSSSLQYHRSFASSSKITLQLTRDAQNRATSPRYNDKEDRKTKMVAGGANSIAKENERIRQLLLDRDGGSASVPTRDGNWDQDMGRMTSKNMHRVLDQTRMSRPGGDDDGRHGKKGS